MEKTDAMMSTEESDRLTSELLDDLGEIGDSMIERHAAKNHLEYEVVADLLVDACMFLAIVGYLDSGRTLEEVVEEVRRRWAVAQEGETVH